MVREDERRTLKAYFSAEPLELVQAVEAALRALLGAQGMTWRAYTGQVQAVEAASRALLGRWE